MAFPQVVAVAASSPAEIAGVCVGDEIRSINGVVPRDIIEYRLLVDDASVSFELSRGGVELEISLRKHAGEPVGVEVSSPVFDRVRTCDNHCEFCFIYQLPKGLRRSLYVKDDDYRLSFLYGNFTTLTRFTELDLERVVSEHLSPLQVSIHATNPDVRSRMLKNRRGATSLRWLRALLDHKIEVHGQVVCCPGVNDGEVLDDTFAGVLDRFPELASVGVVPLGVSKFSKESAMRPHTFAEANEVVDIVERWQTRFWQSLGHPMVHAADEYYLLTNRPFPDAASYGGFPQHENGVGMARSFIDAFTAKTSAKRRHHGGFFASVDGAPAAGYRARRTPASDISTKEVTASITVLTGRYGEAVLRPLFSATGYTDVAICTVDNSFFGGNIGVTGLLAGEDVNAALNSVSSSDRVLLPDVCLSEGRFLDGMSIDDLSHRVEIIATDGASLRQALDARRRSPLLLSVSVP